jgi:hypothetical protein
MVESQFASLKTEIIKKRHPWRSVEQVELATLEWVWWCNNQGLRSALDYRTPAEVEAECYVGKDLVLATAIHDNPRNKTQGDSEVYSVGRGTEKLRTKGSSRS